jgi:iron complex outermembrane receptor protein
MRLQTLSLSTVSVLALAMGSTPAVAQTAAPAPQPEQCANIQDDAARQQCAEASESVDPAANSGDQASAPTQGSASAEGTQANDETTIVVTGSRLRRDERSTVDPVTIIDPDLESREGRFDTADVLQSSPVAAGSTQITSTISSNFVINGGEGVQTISLRGLGSNRTLVLLNGRRAGPAGVRGGVSAFDLNVIPTEAIETIEILKTGASSVYGSDAIAGVVNLITKKDLRGLDLSGFVSVPENSGGEQYSISGTYGIGLGERGNIMIGANFYRHRELERGDRNFLGCEEEFVTNEAGERSDPIDPRTGEPYCGSFSTNLLGIVDFFGGQLIRDDNLLGPELPSAGAPTRRAITAIQFDPSLLPLLGDTGLFFETDPDNPTQFRAPGGFIPVGAYSATALALQNNYDARVNGDSVIPDTKRMTLFAEGGYDVTDNVSLYFEALHNRRKTRTDASRQLFFYQFPGVGETIFSEVYGAYYLPYFFCDGSEAALCDPNAQGDPLNDGFSGAALLQPIVYAPFNSGTDVKYTRGVIGGRADLANIVPNGFADLYLQHSRSDGDYKRDIIFRDAIEFGVAQYRTDLCAGTTTAIRGVPCIDIDYTDRRVLQGQFTPEERAFLFGVDRGNTLYKQSAAELSFGGDIFQLPAGPLKLALGGQLRRDEIRDRPGEATLQGNVWGSTTSGITAGFQRTTEAFGEMEIPVLRDQPFFQALTFNVAGRVTSTYAKSRDGESDSDKGNWTYKVGGNWQPTDWLRFRSTYGTSFRSPALFEQFLADESGFLGQLQIDPCIRYEDNENAQIRENCAAAGIPLDFPGSGGSAETFSSGGIGFLDPETSKAFTASVIFTPQGWLWSGGRFSLTVDYIDINVKDQVTQLGAANIVTGCYASENFPDDPLCSLFVRAPAGGSGAFSILTVQDPYLNIDQQRNKSIDVTTRFRQDLGGMGTLSLLGQANFQLKDKFKLFQNTSANFNGEAGDPKWVGDLNVTWAKDPFTITYGLQVIGPTNDIDNLEVVGGSALNENNCLATNAAFALRNGPYCPVYKLPRVAYHSISAEIEAGERYSFLFGVSNLFDKKPPQVSTVGAPINAFAQVPLLASYYDYYGRRMFVSVRTKLGNLGR